MDSASRLSQAAKGLVQSAQGLGSSSSVDQNRSDLPQAGGSQQASQTTNFSPVISNTESIDPSSSSGNVPNQLSQLGADMAGQVSSGSAGSFANPTNPSDSAFVESASLGSDTFASQATNQGSTTLASTTGQPTSSPDSSQADGQLSEEEIAQLRSSGRLPYVNPAAPMQESALIPGAYKPMPEELLLEWVAPSRPFKKPKRNFFTSITIIGALIGLILFFANQWIPVAVVISVVFLIYVLYSIPPGEVHHALTTYGIRSEEKLYYWEELGRFWITQSKGQSILNIEVARFPNRLSLLLGEISAEDMSAILSEVLLNEKPPLTQVEKMGEWLKQKVPLDLED